jgi:hypothetical protein
MRRCEKGVGVEEDAESCDGEFDCVFLPITLKQRIPIVISFFQVVFSRWYLIDLQVILTKDGCG